jgi:glycosyltransferase involved in cell wall biosynthesis
MRQKKLGKVVMVGTSLDAPGGMSAVVKIYKACGFFEEWNVVYLNTYERPRFTTQMRVMARALNIFLGLLMSRAVSLLHVHSASRGSFWRKSLFCALARVFQVPYVFHLHSGEFSVFAEKECGPFARWWIRSTLASAHSVIALTSSWRNALEAIVPNARIIVLGNPTYVPEKLAPLKNEPFHVVFLGRLREKKGVFDLIKAVPNVLIHLPKVKFTLAGDGDLESVEELAQELGVRDSVRLPGWIEGESKDILLASADVLVLPSYYEGLPICLLEAMSIGVPIVATNVGGIPELLENGKCGFIVSPGDVGALASSLVCALSDRGTAEQMRTRAFMRAVDTYSSQAIIDQLVKIYKEAVTIN